MITCIRKLFLLPVIIAALDLMLAGRVTGQTFAALYSFMAGNDGQVPSGLVEGSDGNFYGAAEYGKQISFTIHHQPWFIVSLDYQFSSPCRRERPEHGDQSPPRYTTVFPVGPAIGTSMNDLNHTRRLAVRQPAGLPELDLYQGAVFKVNANGSGFTSMYTFTGGSDGVNSDAGLILSRHPVYETPYSGGSPSNGTGLTLSIPLQLKLSLDAANLILHWSYQQYPGCSCS